MSKRSITVLTAILICSLFIPAPARSQSAGSGAASPGYMMMTGEDSGIYDRPGGNRLGTVYENIFVEVLGENNGYMRIEGEGRIPEERLSSEAGSLIRKTDVLDKNSQNIVCTLKSSTPVKVLETKDGIATIKYEGWIKNPLLETGDTSDDPYAVVKDKASSTSDPWFR